MARAVALPPALLVLAGGALAALVPLVGVVDTYDGSAVDAWAIAGWVAVLPGLLALILALTAPVAGLAAAAGAGVVGGARFVMDLSVLLDPGVGRPSRTVRRDHRPGRAVPGRRGGFVLLVADLVMLAGGVLGALFGSPVPCRPPTPAPPIEPGPSAERRDPPDPAAGFDAEVGAPDDPAAFPRTPDRWWSCPSGPAAATTSCWSSASSACC